MIYRNPYPTSAKPEYYDRSGCKAMFTKCGQGALVKVNNRQYDYVVNGRLVSQRAGGSMDKLSALVAICMGSQEPKTFLDSRALKTYRHQL